MRRIVLALMVFAATAASALDTPVTFEHPADRARYDNLLEELRCLVCQNQSLADSHADLAQDLRDEVHDMIKAGADDEAIRTFMVERYGEFVLYKPPVTQSTWLLWFGPAILLVAGVVIVLLTTRRRRARAAPLTDAELARARSLLANEEDPA